MLLPSRTAALEGVAAVRGQLQGRKQAAWPLNSSSVLSALAQTVPNRPQLVPDKFWCLFLCARCCRPCSQRLTFAWLVPVHVPSATLHGAVYHSVRKNSFLNLFSVSYGTTSLAFGPLCGGQWSLAFPVGEQRPRRSRARRSASSHISSAGTPIHAFVLGFSA